MKHNLLFLFILLSFFHYSYAQSVIWSRSEDGGGSPTKHATDIYGNNYLTGCFNQPTITFGSITLTNTNSSRKDMYLVKYDSSGNVLWARNSNGLYDETGESVTTDSAGNIYVTGNYNGFAVNFDSITLTNTNPYFLSSEIFLVKYDSSGQVIWAKSYGGQYDDQVSDITTDPAGNLYIAGNFASDTIRFDTTLLSNIDYLYTDIFLAKIDSSGMALWAHRAGGFYNESANTVNTDASGSVYIGGVYGNAQIIFGTDTLHNDSVQTNDAFIAKYSNSGTPLWAQSYGGVMDDEIVSITADKNNNEILAGNFRSHSITFDTITFFNIDMIGSYGDMFFVKLDSSGNLIWARKAGELYPDHVESVTTDSAGYIYFTGQWYPLEDIYFGTIHLSSLGGLPEFLVKYSPLGVPIWAMVTDGYAYKSCISWSPVNNLYLSYTSGLSTANMKRINDTTTLPCIGPPSVLFTDTVIAAIAEFTYIGSTAALDSVEWRFGDGTIANGLTPHHTFATPGTYTVCAIAYTQCGTDTFCQDVVISCPVAATYSAFLINTTAMPDISFTYSGTIWGLDSVVWTFGDGAAYTGLTSNHTYTAPGLYNVCAELFSSCGNDTSCQNVHIIGTGLTNNIIKQTRIYPNPADNKLIVSSANQISDVIISDLLGRIVYTQTCNGETITINVAQLPRGVYLLQTTDSSGMKTTNKFEKK